MTPKSGVRDSQKQVKCERHHSKIEDGLDWTWACERPFSNEIISFWKPLVRNSKSNKKLCQYALAMQHGFLGCSGPSWKPFWGVHGLLHGGAGKKKLVFLATRGMFYANFAFRRCPETNLEAMWTFWEGPEQLFASFPREFFCILERTHSIYMTDMCPWRLVETLQG